jgi:hypothetical protein
MRQVYLVSLLALGLVLSGCASSPGDDGTASSSGPQTKSVPTSSGKSSPPATTGPQPTGGPSSSAPTSSGTTTGSGLEGNTTGNATSVLQLYVSGDPNADTCTAGLLVATLDEVQGGGCLFQGMNPVLEVAGGELVYNATGTSTQAFASGTKVTGSLFYYSLSPTSGSARVLLTAGGAEVGSADKTFSFVGANGWSEIKFDFTASAAIPAGSALVFEYTVIAPGVPDAFSGFGYGGTRPTGLAIGGDYTVPTA